MEATPRLELGVEILQTSALPLGYVAIGAGNEATGSAGANSPYKRLRRFKGE